MSIKHKIAGKINGVIRRTRWFNEEMFPDCRKFWEYNKFNTDVINLGSTSGCHAFDYEGLPICGGNFALRHNPLSGDLAILKNYLTIIKFCLELSDLMQAIYFTSLCIFSTRKQLFYVQ